MLTQEREHERTQMTAARPSRWEESDQFRASHPERQLDVSGVTWRYVIGGQGEYSLVVLPGGLRLADPFFVLFNALEPKYRVIAPSYPPVPTMAALVSGVVAILDAEHIQRTHLFGESFGGELAQSFVRCYPERVDKLVLANTAPPHARIAGPLRRITTILRLLPTGLLRALAKRLLLRFLSAPPDQRAFWQALIKDIVDRRLTRADILSFFTETVDFHAHYSSRPEDLARWSGRIQIIESSDDRAVPRVSREALKRLYPQARVYTFSQAGHTPWLTEPRAYFSVIQMFLADP